MSPKNPRMNEEERNSVFMEKDSYNNHIQITNQLRGWHQY